MEIAQSLPGVIDAVAVTVITAVRGQLRGVQQIAATSAFAAVLEDRSVVGCAANSGHGRGFCWTVPQFESSSEVWSRFRAQIGHLPGVLEDGSIITWGDRDEGGGSSRIGVYCGLNLLHTLELISKCRFSTFWNRLKGVLQIQATGRAFAAILEDGFVITWGGVRCGQVVFGWKMPGGSVSRGDKKPV